MAKIHYGVKNIEKTRGPKNVQNSIWGKTGHHKMCPQLGLLPPESSSPGFFYPLFHPFVEGFFVFPTPSGNGFLIPTPSVFFCRVLPLSIVGRRGFSLHFSWEESSWGSSLCVFQMRKGSVPLVLLSKKKDGKGSSSLFLKRRTNFLSF